jgi:NAD(P)-dependent dehydrogenase (short-subunit alcohol dehydrogenase family)
LKKHPKALIEVEELDLSKSECIKKFIETIAHKYKKVDVLVNNAAIAGLEFTPEVVHNTFASVTIKSNTECLRYYRIE